MPGKKKKYNARFPPARIKKIMQSDEDVGKVAAPVPVIISRALELFSETLLLRAKKVTAQRGARTLTPSHLKFCIQSEKRFDFLKDLVSSVPELQGDMDNDLTPAGANPSELRHVPGNHVTHVPGLGRGRGVGAASSPSTTRPVVPGTGKRRGRPPKALGAPPSARTKRSVDKFVDDEYDVRDVKDEDEPAPAAQFSYKPSSSEQLHARIASALQQSQQEQLSRRLSQSSPIVNSVLRSDSQNSPLTPASPAPFTLHLQSNTVMPPSYQRTNSSPLYTPPLSRPALKSPPPLTPIAPKTPSWSMTHAFTDHQSSHQSNGHSFNAEATNGSFSLTPLPSASQPSFTSPLFSAASTSTSSSRDQELDEDYDC